MITDSLRADCTVCTIHAQSAQSAVSEKANVSAVFPKILYLNTKSNQDRTANCKASPGNYLTCGASEPRASAISRRSAMRASGPRLLSRTHRTPRPPSRARDRTVSEFFEMCQKCEILKYFKFNIDIHILGCYYSNCHKTYVTHSAGKARRRWL